MFRVPDGGVRNRYLCFDNGRLVGQHDKDLPTMWENAFYEGADEADTGELGEIDGIRVGSAVCWEFIRTQAARRLRGKVDVIMGGSHWWSVPLNWPRWLVGVARDYSSDNLMRSVQETARLIGAPVVHGSHCNQFTCKTPGFPYPINTYEGVLEGNAAIVDAEGVILARRYKEEGEGFVIAEISPGAVSPKVDVPNRYWLRQRTLLVAFSWYYHGFLGRRWYIKNVKDNVKPFSLRTDE